MKFGTDSRGAQRINPSDFGYPLKFLLVPKQVKVFTHQVKYLDIYKMDFYKILYMHSWCPEDESN